MAANDVTVNDVMATAAAARPPLDARSLALRNLIVDGLEGGGRGHPGSALSLVEILRVLYDDVLRVDPARPDWPDRDRFILSKGHGCLALFALLADKGFFPTADLWGHCRAGTHLGGHPERGHTPGVEASTGALGHGLSIGVGMALAARISGRPSRVFVAMGDGEINEGSVWEAAMTASKHRLDHLTAIIDYNKLQSYGPVRDVLDMEPLADKWRAFGFAVREVDGHDVAALRAVFAGLPFETGRPSMVICHTIKGRGLPFAEGDPKWHHKSKLKPEELAAIRAALEPR
jgi:transketolase